MEDDSGKRNVLPRPDTVEHGSGGIDTASANLKAVLLSHGLFLARGLCSQNAQWWREFALYMLSKNENFSHSVQVTSLLQYG